jgi:hypothetical protein
VNNLIPADATALGAAYGEYIRMHGKSWAIAEMAADYGCDPATVRRRLAIAGIRAARETPRRPAEADLRARYEAVAAEHGDRAVTGKLAAEFGVTTTTIRQWAEHYGIRSRKPMAAAQRPIEDACPCGAVATTRYKGQDPPLCFRCYMRTRAAEEAKAGTSVRVSRDYAVRLKEGKPCTDCGRKFPACCMHWDHVPERGPKLFNLGRADYALERVLAEVAKCDLVCANCHAIRTWNRKHPEAPVSLEPVPGASEAAVTAGVSCLW